MSLVGFVFEKNFFRCEVVSESTAYVRFIAKDIDSTDESETHHSVPRKLFNRMIGKESFEFQPFKQKEVITEQLGLF